MHREAEADVHVFIYVLVYSFLNIRHVIMCTHMLK